MLLRILGPFEADAGDGAPDLGGPRQRAVLALLLTARGEVVSVDRMIEDLWRGEAPPRAIASLQAYVSNLRRLLEPARERRAPARLLVSAPPGYALRLPADAVDAWRFERLLAEARAAAAADPHRARVLLLGALQLWRGEAFAEFADEPWAQAEVVRLGELRLAARELLLDVSLRSGAAAEAAAEAEVLSRQYPLREELWRLLALALWSTGRQADALAALRRARATLADELGLDPGPALTELEAAILAQRVDLLDAALAARAPTIASGGGGARGGGGVRVGGAGGVAVRGGAEAGAGAAGEAGVGASARLSDGGAGGGGAGGVAARADAAVGTTAAHGGPAHGAALHDGAAHGGAAFGTARHDGALRGGVAQGGAAHGTARHDGVAQGGAAHGAARHDGAARDGVAFGGVGVWADVGDKSEMFEMRDDGGEPALFVGREAELAALLDAAARSPQVVLLTGEAGVGKTSVLGRFRSELQERGWLVAEGRCPEVEGAPPAWAWVEALRALAREAPPGELRAALGPLLDEDAAAARGAADGDVAAGRFRLHRAVAAWLREAAARRPVAIVLDDLHAADAETLMLLAGLAEAVEPGGPRMLLVAALRPADNRERLAGTMAQLARRSAVRVPLQGLETPDVARLVAAFARTGVDAETVAALAERTGGNPFYVRESARLLASEGALVATSDVPEGVRDVLRRRLSRLPPAAVAVLRLAAVVGREADVETLVEAADADEGAVLDALEAGLIAGLLTEPAPGRVRFVHGLVRDTMYTDLSQLRRTRMHARVAACTRRLRPDDLPALAHHYARAASAETAPLAVQYAVRAAELAERRFAYDAAAELLAAAVQTAATMAAAAVPGGDRDALVVDLLGGLLRAQARAGAVAAARQTRDRALDVAVAAGREDLLVEAFTAWQVPTPWQIREYGISDDRAIDLLVRLLRRDDLDPVARCRLLDALTNELDGEGDPRATAAGVEALELARGLGDPALLALGLAARVRTMSFDVDVEPREALALELRALAEEHGLVAYHWMAEQTIGNCAAASGRPDDTRAAIHRQGVIARAYHLAEPLAIHLAARAALAHVEGDFAGSQALYDECAEHMRRQGSLHTDSFQFLGTATLLLSQGQFGRYVEPTRQIREAVGPIADDAYAFALAEAGRLDEARAIPIAEHRIRPDYFASALYTIRARAILALGRTDLAQPVIDALRPVRGQLAGLSSTSMTLAPVALTLGELLRLQGREGEAEEHFRLAVDVARSWGAAHWAAQAEAALNASADRLQ